MIQPWEALTIVWFANGMLASLVLERVATWMKKRDERREAN